MNPTHGITRRRAIAAVAATAALPFRSLAQSERPVRVIVGSSAGATIDVMARTAQSALASALGAPVVVENVAGAGGVIAMQTLARSAPDGSVLVLHTNNMVIAPLLIKPAPYDPVADFTPIGMVGSIPLGIVVNPSKIQARDPKEFVAVLKTRGEALNYGSSGNGTTLHLARTDPGRGRHEGQAHSLQGRGTDGQRSAGRAGRLHRHLTACGAGAHQERLADRSTCR